MNRLSRIGAADVLVRLNPRSDGRPVGDPEVHVGVVASWGQSSGTGLGAAWRTFLHSARALRRGRRRGHVLARRALLVHEDGADAESPGRGDQSPLVGVEQMGDVAALTEPSDEA